MHRIHDPVYGYIDLYDYERKLIDSLLFQRLRGIHQQGTAYLTYPGSTHDRFSHSLGVMKTASDFIHSLARIGGPEFRSEITPLMTRVLRVICLSHDLGHGPFSHVSERIFRAKLSNEEKVEMEELGIRSAHELFSYKLVKDFLPDYLDYISEEYAKSAEEAKQEIYVSFEEFRKTLTESGPLFFAKTEEPLMYYSRELRRKLPCWKVFRQILGSDFDADKIDYIQRDGYVAGMKIGHLDALGLLENAIIDYSEGAEDTAFSRQAISAIETLILERYKLFRWLNFHHTVCFSDELMARVIELSDKEAFGDNTFTYHTFSHLAREDLEALKSHGMHKPYDVDLLNDSNIIYNVREAYRKKRNDPDLQVARYYLNILEARQFFTAVWRTDTLLEPQQEKILFDLKSQIDKELDSDVSLLEGSIKQIENEIANTLRIDDLEDVVISYKPFEPVSPHIYLKVLTDDGFKNVSDVSSVISLLEWRRRARPAEIRERILDTIHEISSKKEVVESFQASLVEEIQDIPQIYTPIYVFIKGLSRESRGDIKNQIFGIIEKYIES